MSTNKKPLSDKLLVGILGGLFFLVFNTHNAQHSIENQMASTHQTLVDLTLSPSDSPIDKHSHENESCLECKLFAFVGITIASYYSPSFLVPIFCMLLVPKVGLFIWFFSSIKSAFSPRAPPNLSI